MSLAPYLLAVFSGLLISALLHFVLVWPAREPADDGAPPDAESDAQSDTKRDPAEARRDRA